MNPERWRVLMHALDLPESPDSFLALSESYREPHRHYHTQAHIDDCLEKFDLVRDLAPNPNAIELALWFHDAVYNPYRADNEEKSAEWAARFLRGGKASTEVVDRICRLILATRHAIVPADADTALLIDVDLSILGADPARYHQFEAEVRNEYRWVPRFLYRRKRAEILESFLRRPRIYASDLFHSRFETQARQNLRVAIGNLS